MKNVFFVVLEIKLDSSEKPPSTWDFAELLDMPDSGDIRQIAVEKVRSDGVEVLPSSVKYNIKEKRNGRFLTELNSMDQFVEFSGLAFRALTFDLDHANELVELAGIHDLSSETYEVVPVDP